MDKNKSSSGSVERGLVGDFELPLGAVFSEAWANVKGIKGVVFMGQIYLLFLISLLSFVGILFSVFLGSIIAFFQPFFHFITAVFTGAIFICGMAFLNRIAMRNLAGKEFGIKHFFRPYAFFWQSLGLYILSLISLTVISGLCFLFLFFAVLLDAGASSILLSSLSATHVSGSAPGHVNHWVSLFVFVDIFICFLIYSFFMTVFQLVIPAAMDQKIKIKLAMRFLFKALSKKFISIVLINLISIVIILVSLIPIGLGLIWSLPLAYSLNAVIYKKSLGFRSVA